MDREARANGYRGAYRDLINKIKRTETVSSKRAALMLAQDAEAQIWAGTWHDPGAGLIMFSRYPRVAPDRPEATT